MTLSSLIPPDFILAATGDPAAAISGLDYDSRRVQPGWLFFAIRGEKADGNRFVPQALASGAIAIASEAAPSDAALAESDSFFRNGGVWVQVSDARKALSLASAAFHGHPARDIRLIGITGTNGKTTTTFLVDAVLNAAGRKTGLFGTIEYRLAGRRLPAPHTTPESLELQSYLARLREQGGTHAVMEVSSHALALDRVYGCPFEVAVFTNLTRDHLDFHGTMEAYFAEKRKLFTGSGAQPPEWAVLNADDPHSPVLLNCGSPNVLTYGFGPGADVRPHPEHRDPPSDRPWERPRPAGSGSGPAGSGSRSFRMVTPSGQLECRSPLLGRPNMYNLLAAAATGLALGLDAAAIERGLASLENVPGRFERVDAGQPFIVAVDYAHTDDALRNLIATARSLAGPGGRVITLFGCGGDRDRAKRPLMGEAAGDGSDAVVLTSDNPRSEDPMRIIEDALEGLKRTPARYQVEPDRARAIELAIGEAREGDVVLIAGKGHETYQIIGDRRLPFDDVDVARAALQTIGRGH